MAKSKTKAPSIKTTLDIEMWDIDDLKPYSRNARVIPESAVTLVANSIKTYGFQQPIVVDENGVIIVGHTRHKAAKSLNLSEVPVTVARNLTSEQVDAYRLMDNRANQETAWDVDVLKDVLSEMGNSMDNSLLSEMTGFSEKELEVYVGDLATTPSLDVSDDVDKPRKEKKDQDEKCKCPKCGYTFSPASEDDAEHEAKTTRKTPAKPEPEEEDDEEDEAKPAAKKSSKPPVDEDAAPKPKARKGFTPRPDDDD